MPTSENCEQIIYQMDQLLDQEVLGLRSGQWDVIEPLSKLKTELFSELQKSWPVQPTERLYNMARYIQRKSEHVGLLQKSAMAGIKFAQSKLRELESSKSKIGTYKLSGQQMFLSEDNYFEEKKV